MKRNWTYIEINQLRYLRLLGYTVKKCAKLLKRSNFSIRQQCFRSKIIIQKKKPLPHKIKQLVKRGRTDNFISLKLGITLHSIRYHRKKLKIPANQERRKKKRSRCFGCNKIAPIPIAKGWSKLAGWKIEKFSSYSKETIAFCPNCFF